MASEQVLILLSEPVGVSSSTTSRRIQYRRNKIITLRNVVGSVRTGLRTRNVGRGIIRCVLCSSSSHRSHSRKELPIRAINALVARGSVQALTEAMLNTCLPLPSCWAVCLRRRMVSLSSLRWELGVYQWGEASLFGWPL